MGEEREDAGTGMAAPWQVVIFEAGSIAAIGNGMEVEAKGFCLRTERWRQGLDPPGQQAAMLFAGGAIGKVGGIALFGEDVQPGEPAQGLVEVEVVDVAVALLVEQFEGQQPQ